MEERAANASGEIRGLSVPLGDFWYPSVLLLRTPWSLCNPHKPPLHQHFLHFVPGVQSYVRQLWQLTWMAAILVLCPSLADFSQFASGTIPGLCDTLTVN
jgi:hypothetical protein